MSSRDVLDSLAWPTAPSGCLYQGKEYAVGETMDKIASKCMFVKCQNGKAGPETVLNYISKTGCE